MLNRQRLDKGVPVRGTVETHGRASLRLGTNTAPYFVIITR